MKYHIFNIKWDCENEEDFDNLPKEITEDFETETFSTEEEIDDFLGDWLTDKFGWCHKGFSYEIDKPSVSKVHRAVLNIDEKDLEYYENLLCRKNVSYDDMGIGEYSTIKKWCVKFDDGCEADLKVNSNHRTDGDFYAEMVLFDQNGCQIDCSEAEYNLGGLWTMEGGILDDYWVDVRVRKPHTIDK